MFFFKMKKSKEIPTLLSGKNIKKIIGKGLILLFQILILLFQIFQKILWYIAKINCENCSNFHDLEGGGFLRVTMIRRFGNPRYCPNVFVFLVEVQGFFLLLFWFVSLLFASFLFFHLCISLFFRIINFISIYCHCDYQQQYHIKEIHWIGHAKTTSIGCPVSVYLLQC